MSKSPIPANFMYGFHGRHFQTCFWIMTSQIASSSPKYNCVEISKIIMLNFFIFHVRLNLQSSRCFCRGLERFKLLLCMLKVFWSRDRTTEISMIAGVQKWQFFSEKWTMVERATSTTPSPHSVVYKSISTVQIFNFWYCPFFNDIYISHKSFYVKSTIEK